MFSVRDHSPEIMDDTSIGGAELNNALTELKVINRFLGGNSVTLEGIKKLFGSGNHTSVSILDAGSGGGTNFDSIKKKYNIHLIPLDKNPHACGFIKLNNRDQSAVCADVYHLPFKDKSIDAVHSALLLHHFTEDALRIIINEYFRVCRKGIIINDLRRSVWAYIGIKILTLLFSRSKMVKNDGPLSVKRGFKAKELRLILNDTGTSGYILKRKWAFRWLLVIPLNEKKF